MTQTARAALILAIRRLSAAGVQDPARDSRLLLAHALGLAPDRLMLHLDDRLDPDAASRFESAISAREMRQPVSQIIGRRKFWGHDFVVTRDVLDPRPETETLILAALDEPFSRVLDLGTGSGAIVLSLLAERTQATGLGVDVSQAAIEVARVNAAALGVSARVEMRVSDWFASVDGVFDLIVSNPPYIGEDEMQGLAPETRDWEPHLALTPGGDGLAAYRAIASGAAAVLRPGGRILLEIGPVQGAAVVGLLRWAGFDDISILPDLDGRDRVVRARMHEGANGC